MQKFFKPFSKSLFNVSKRYISVGETIPHVNLKLVEWKNGEYATTVLDSHSAFANQRVILIGFPGAFTPSCENVHLPEYIKRAAELKADGTDKIFAMSVNDPFVLGAFAKKLAAGDAITWIADGNGEFTKALDAGVDLSGPGLGFRSRRFTMIIENKKVVEFNDEKGPQMTDLSRVVSVLSQLGKLKKKK
eukprot:CAMPEP_0176410924 /NCGR_PEP_ID=MMETSP0127-20121128/3323_1 /TAXON_ID=938130 /ORGANISM="Platyophrya macrostoma, Strain WH" /LENGTH=189 /DNA_ID=CAMNT_0017790467 /DNA_START=21 /DNA_END=590 /DNA_ORIENTATION=-